MRPRVDRSFRLQVGAELLYTLLAVVLFQVVKRLELAVRSDDVKRHADLVFGALLRVTASPRPYAHRLVVLLLEYMLDLGVRLDLLVQKLHSSLRHGGSLLRLEKTAEVRENHAIAGGEARFHGCIGVESHRNVPSSVCCASRRTLVHELPDLLKLRIVFEEITTLVQLENRIIVESEKLVRRSIETVFVCLSDQTLNILLVVHITSYHINRRTLRLDRLPKCTFTIAPI